MQSRQHKQSGKLALQLKHAYRQAQLPREVLRGEGSKVPCTRCQGQHCTQGWRGPHRNRSCSGARARTAFSEIAHGDAKRPVDEDMSRVSTRLPKCQAVGRERFPVAGPGKAHGRPRTVVFVLACTNRTLVWSAVRLEQRERVVSVAPYMPEMEAEVDAVTRHRSLTRLEAAKPRTAPSLRLKP